MSASGSHGSVLPRVGVVVGGAVPPLDFLRSSAEWCEVVFLVTQGDDRAWADRQEYAQFRRLVDVTVLDQHALQPAALARLGLDAITTAADDHLGVVCHVAAELNLRYNTSQTVQLLTDKYFQRRRLGFPDAHAVDDADQLAHRARMLSGDYVLKPRHASASRGNRRLRLPTSDLDGWAPSEPCVLEGYLGDGTHQGRPHFNDQVSVESVTVDGATVHLTVTDKFAMLPGFIETGDVMPSTLPDDVAKEVVTLTATALKRLGVTQGMTHTEIKLTPEGPRIIEVNGRIGGGVGTLLELAFGLHGAEIVLRAACGELPDWDGVAHISSGEVMIQPPAGALFVPASMPYDAIAAISGVVGIERMHPEGAALDLTDASTSRVASVWLQGPVDVVVAAEEQVRRLMADVAWPGTEGGT